MNLKDSDSKKKPVNHKDKQGMENFLKSNIQLSTQIAIFEQKFNDEIKSVSVASAICKHGDKYLFLKRSEQVVNSGEWVLPGGKLEGEEGPKECLYRELQEETGIVRSSISTVLPLRRFGVDNQQINYDLFVYFCVLSSIDKPQVRLNRREHSDYAWLSMNEALKLNLMPAQRKVLNCILGDSVIDSGPEQAKLINFRRIKTDSIRTNIFRSAAPSLDTYPSSEKFISQGINRIIDLRSGCEVSQAEEKAWGDIRISAPMGSATLIGEIKEKIESKLMTSHKAESMMFKFLSSLACREQLSKLFKQVETCLAEGNVLIFCKAGKDRTGIASMYIKHILGCSFEAIKEDYLLSRSSIQNQNIPEHIEPFTRVNMEYFEILYSKYISKQNI